MKYSSQIKKMKRFDWFLMLKYDFNYQNFDIFAKVVHNFGESDDDII